MADNKSIQKNIILNNERNYRREGVLNIAWNIQYNDSFETEYDSIETFDGNSITIKFDDYDEQWECYLYGLDETITGKTVIEAIENAEGWLDQDEAVESFELLEIKGVYK